MKLNLYSLKNWFFWGTVLEKGDGCSLACTLFVIIIFFNSISNTLNKTWPGVSNKYL